MRICLLWVAPELELCLSPAVRRALSVSAKMLDQPGLCLPQNAQLAMLRSGPVLVHCGWWLLSSGQCKTDGAELVAVSGRVPDGVHCRRLGPAQLRQQPGQQHAGPAVRVECAAAAPCVPARRTPRLRPSMLDDYPTEAAAEALGLRTHANNQAWPAFKQFECRTFEY